MTPRNMMVQFFRWIILLYMINISHGSGPVLIKLGDKKAGKKNQNLILIAGGKCGSPTLIKGGDKKGQGQMILVGGPNNGCEETSKQVVMKQFVPVPYYVPKPVYKYVLRHHYIPVKQLIVKPVPVPYPVKVYGKKKKKMFYDMSYSNPGLSYTGGGSMYYGGGGSRGYNSFNGGSSNYGDSYNDHNGVSSNYGGHTNDRTGGSLNYGGHSNDHNGESSNQNRGNDYGVGYGSGSSYDKHSSSEPSMNHDRYENLNNAPSNSQSNLHTNNDGSNNKVAEAYQTSPINTIIHGYNSNLPYDSSYNSQQSSGSFNSMARDSTDSPLSSPQSSSLENNLEASQSSNYYFGQPKKVIRYNDQYQSLPPINQTPIDSMNDISRITSRQTTFDNIDQPTLQQQQETTNNNGLSLMQPVFSGPNGRFFTSNQMFLNGGGGRSEKNSKTFRRQNRIIMSRDDPSDLVRRSSGSKINVKIDKSDDHFDDLNQQESITVTSVLLFGDESSSPKPSPSSLNKRKNLFAKRYKTRIDHRSFDARLSPTKIESIEFFNSTSST